MTKLKSTFAALLLTVVTFAQEKPVISSAVIEFNKFLNTNEAEDISQSKKYIDEAHGIITNKSLAEVNPKQLAKFYYYYGEIYMLIANSSNDAVLQLDATAPDKALWGFKNLLEFEKTSGKERYTNKVKSKIVYIPGNFINRGIKKADAEDFSGAYDDFMQAYELNAELSEGKTVDTSMFYNAAYMAQRMENFERAFEMNKELIKMGYKGITYEARDATTGKPRQFRTEKELQEGLDAGDYLEPKIGESLLPSIYVTAINLATKLKKEDEKNMLVKQARANFPANMDFIIFELQEFLDKKDYDGALKNMELALEKDSTNELFLFNVGIITLNNLKNPTKAREYFEKVLQVNPKNGDAMYMIGVLDVNEANTLTEKINKLGLNETKKYNKLKADQKKIFEKALVNFEKAYEIIPEDPNLIQALQQVYYNVGNYEKSMEMQAILDELNKE